MNRRDMMGLTLAATTAPVSAFAAKQESSASVVSIDYDLGQHGWSSFVLQVGGKSTEVGQFSYTTDALDDLILAAISVASTASRAEVSFDGEPMEWRLVVDQGWKTDMRLRILTFPDSFKKAPESEGSIDFEARVLPDDFARAVQRAALEVWTHYGAKGYREAWGGGRGFPLRALKALDAALSTTPV